MRGITLHQPWASFISCGLKQFETRSWQTRYRGKLLIQAALKAPPDLVELALLWDKIEATGGKPPSLKMPFGCIVAIAEITDCKLMWPASDFSDPDAPLALDQVRAAKGQIIIDDQSPLERLVGDWSQGRYAWKLDNVQPLEKPIPYKGKQGLWKPSLEIETSILKSQEIKV